MKNKIIKIISVSAICIILLLMIISYIPFRRPLPDDIVAEVITIKGEKYLFFSSKIEQAIRNPLYPIEFIDYKFKDGRLIITKYVMFNFIPLLRDDPLLYTFPIAIHESFFNNNMALKIAYWSTDSYKNLEWSQNPSTKKSSANSEI